MRNRFLSLALAAACALGVHFAVSAASAAEESYNLSIGGIQSAEDTATKAMRLMADKVKEKTGGAITLEVFPASQLGDATTQIEAVGMGSQDMFVDAGGFISAFVPDKDSESMFFLFDSEAHYRAFLESDVTKQIERDFLDQTGVRVIANNWVRVPRCTASKKPLNSLADFEGLKTRVPDIRAYLESLRALGASPTQVPWGETYLALKQGLVDAAEGPLDQLYTMNFHEAANNIILTNHLRDNLIVTINNGKFEGMSDAQRAALLEAAKEAGDWYSETCRKAAGTNARLMKEAGCNFIEIDIAPLQAAVLKRAEELEKEGAWKAGIMQTIADANPAK